MIVMATRLILENLLSCALSVNPEPDGVDRDADHGGARHDVAESVRPPNGHNYHWFHHRKCMRLPWVVITLVDDVLPSEQLK